MTIKQVLEDLRTELRVVTNSLASQKPTDVASRFDLAVRRFRQGQCNGLRRAILKLEAIGRGAPGCQSDPGDEDDRVRRVKPAELTRFLAERAEKRAGQLQKIADMPSAIPCTLPPGRVEAILPETYTLRRALQHERFVVDALIRRHKRLRNAGAFQAIQVETMNAISRARVRVVALHDLWEDA